MKKIYFNAVIYTFNKTTPIVEAIVTNDGKIVDFGSTNEMVTLWDSKTTKLIDLKGKAVTPGLVDSHLHIADVATNYLHLDLSGTNSKQQFLEIVKEKSEKLDESEWLIGRGWDENLFKDGSTPSIKELDLVAPGVPLFLTRICGHAFLVNSKALELINYHPSIEIPEGGNIELDSKTNQPTGLILETASELFEQYIPSYTYKEMKNAIRKALYFAISQGLTSVHTNDPATIGSLESTYKIYDELINKEGLPIRVNLLINHEFMSEIEKLDMYAGYGNDKLQIGAIKIFADGAMGPRTAYLTAPYADAPDEYGKPIYNQQTLYTIIKKARKLKMPVAIHTIGDKALENVLDTLDAAPPASYPDRLIHVQVVNEKLIQRLASSNRCADIQPRFLASDFPWVEERLGRERMEYAYAWNSLLKANVICSGGSDAPVEPINPLLGIHAAVTRKIPTQLDNKEYNANEKISMEDGFRLFTELGAYPTGEEKIKGTIDIGKFADMTVYTQDPFTLENKDDLLYTSIEMTILNGDIAYQK